MVGTGADIIAPPVEADVRVDAFVHSFFALINVEATELSLFARVGVWPPPSVTDRTCSYTQIFLVSGLPSILAINEQYFCQIDFVKKN